MVTSTFALTNANSVILIELKLSLEYFFERDCCVLDVFLYALQLCLSLFFIGLLCQIRSQLSLLSSFSFAHVIKAGFTQMLTLQNKFKWFPLSKVCREREREIAPLVHSYLCEIHLRQTKCHPQVAIYSCIFFCMNKAKGRSTLFICRRLEMQICIRD